MGRLEGKTAVVTGGSRGLGKAIVKALAGEGAKVWAVARNEANLAKLRDEMPDVTTLAIDVTAPDAAERIFGTVTPDILVMSAGVAPRMAPVHEQSWDEFSGNWQVDVRSTFQIGGAALRASLPAGAQVVTISSGAALSGSFGSGGYAGAKRMQWFLSDYFRREAKVAGKDTRFVAVLPKRIFADTDLGDASSAGYATQLGVSQADFLGRFTAYTADEFGRDVVAILLDETYRDGTAFAVNGDGIETLAA